MHRYLPALSLAVFFLFGARATTPAAEQIAGKFVALAKVADAAGLSKLFHYPPNMSEAEQKKDAEAVSRDLAWLLAEFGNPTSVKATTARVEFYELGVYGGTNAYWKSISPVSDTQFIYEATFSKLGPGYLKILVLNSGATAGRELHAAWFGIPSTSPGAKEKAIDLTMGLIEHSDMPVPPNFRRILEGQLKPSQALPAQ